MSAERSYNITEEEAAEIAIGFQKTVPGYVWGKGELRNAIFEALVFRHNLPWNHDIGAPDFNNPQVKILSEEFFGLFEKEEDAEIIDGVEGKCKTENCGWSEVGQVKIDKIDRALFECELTKMCRIHHYSTRITNLHNRFDLYKDGEQIGGASASSQASTGYVEPLE